MINPIVIHKPIVYINTSFINNPINPPYRISLASHKLLQYKPIHIVLNEFHYTALAPVNSNINALFANTQFYNSYKNFIIPDIEFE